MRQLKLETIARRYTELGDEGFTLEYNEKTLKATLFRISNRSRAGRVSIWSTKFYSLDQMKEYINTDYHDRVRRLTTNQKTLSAERLQIEKDRENVVIGDVFSYSWGWEQTNVEFYQVIDKPSPATIIVRPISCIAINKQEIGEYVVPLKDHFIGDDAERVRLNGKSFKRANGDAKLTNYTQQHYRLTEKK